MTIRIVTATALFALLLAASGHWADISEAAPAGCYVNGGGGIRSGAQDLRFGGTAALDDSFQGVGHWSHVDAAGSRLNGTIEFLRCRQDGGGPPDPPAAGQNLATFGGSATWNGEAGYEFEVYVEDRGEPNVRDYYMLTVCAGACTSTGETVVYVVFGELTQGNIQFHPPNAAHP